MTSYYTTLQKAKKIKYWDAKTSWSLAATALSPTVVVVRRHVLGAVLKMMGSVSALRLGMFNCVRIFGCVVGVKTAC